MGKNTKKKLKIAGKEKASRPKKVYQGNRNKERLRKLRRTAFHNQNLQALVVSQAKTCSLSSSIDIE